MPLTQVTPLTKSISFLEKSALANVAFPISRCTDPETRHNKQCTNVTYPISNKVLYQPPAATEPEPIPMKFFTVSYDRAYGTMGAFVLVAPTPIVEWFLEHKATIAKFVAHVTDEIAYELEIETYTQKARSGTIETINYAWIELPPGCTHGELPLRQLLDKHVSKFGSRLTDYQRGKDPETEAPLSKVRIEFSTDGAQFSVAAMHKATFVDFDGYDKKFLASPEFCKEHGLHRECLRFLPGGDKTSWPICDCTSAPHINTAAINKKRKSDAAAAFARRQAARQHRPNPFD